MVADILSAPMASVTTPCVMIADTEGRIGWYPTAIIQALQAKGVKLWKHTIPIPPAPPPPRSEPPHNQADWLTVTEAARLHLADVDGLTIARATDKVSRACSRGRLRSVGFGTARRIDPSDFASWRLRQRERDLGRSDEID